MMKAYQKSGWSLWKRVDHSLLVIAGLLFVLAAILLTVREVSLGLGIALFLFTGLSAMFSLVTKNQYLRLGLFLAALTGALAAACTYVVQIETLNPWYLLSPLTLLGLAALWLLLFQRRIGSESPVGANRGLQALLWPTLALSLFIASWGFYYQYITFGLAPGFHLRRLLLTGFWAAMSLILYYHGRQKQHVGLFVPGIVLLGVACIKAVLYDTTHLEGFDRIIMLAVMGGLLSTAGLYMNRQTTRPDDTPPVVRPVSDVQLEQGMCRENNVTKVQGG